MSEPHESLPPPTDKPVTQADVARLAGVSRAVVSYVINNGPRTVSPEARQRVLEAIAVLGYRPNKFAQGLKFSSTEQARGHFGIILGGATETLLRPYYSAVLASLYQETHRRGGQIRFVTFLNELKDPVFFNKNVHAEEIAGLILVAGEAMLRDPQWPDILPRIRERIANGVSLEHPIGDFPTVRFDRVLAARKAVSHLVSLGHTRIALVGYPDDRLDGYRYVLLEHGLPEWELVDYPGLIHTPDRGYQMTRQLMARPERPTALFATSDEVAIGALAALQDMGFRVPGDIALASIDDIALARMVRPALTTVRVPVESFATYALRMLETHEQYPNSEPASVLLETELIVRDSCGAR